MFHILMNPTRTRIMRFLALNGPSDRNRISARLGISPSAAGHHMAVLEHAGLIQRRPDTKTNITRGVPFEADKYAIQGYIRAIAEHLLSIDAAPEDQG
ncbi:MAG: Helix-turn-helix domain [Spirosoma sp.]|nr:Helix-turn-helix domain [Spirosoma sp.]